MYLNINTMDQISSVAKPVNPVFKHKNIPPFILECILECWRAAQGVAPHPPIALAGFCQQTSFQTPPTEEQAAPAGRPQEDPRQPSPGNKGGSKDAEHGGGPENCSCLLCAGSQAFLL